MISSLIWVLIMLAIVVGMGWVVVFLWNITPILGILAAFFLFCR